MVKRNGRKRKEKESRKEEYTKEKRKAESGLRKRKSVPSRGVDREVKGS